MESEIVKSTKAGFIFLFFGYDLKTKKPFVRFYLANTQKNKDYLASDMRVINDLARRIKGSYDKNAQFLEVEILGASKVHRAIEAFLQDKRYSSASNNKLRNDLAKYLQVIQSSFPAKVRVPRRAKLQSAFEVAEELDSESLHKTQLWFKKKKPKSKWFFKFFPGRRAIVEIEAFNGLCYQLLLNERAPKTQTVIDETGNKIGIASKAMPSYIPWRQFHHGISHAFYTERVIKTRAAEVWAAAYCEEENDLHSENFGVNGDDIAVKIDHDQASYPLTGKYINDPDKKRRFQLTEQDILRFPYLQNTYPYNWVPKSLPIKHIEYNNEFIKQKYFIFLKRILIEDNVYKSLAEATLSSSKMQARYMKHKIEQTVHLKKLLLAMPDFWAYVYDNYTDLIDDLRSDFEEYNALHKKHTDKPLQVNISSIMKNFDAVYRCCSGRFMLLRITEPEKFFAMRTQREEATKKIRLIRMIDNLIASLESYITSTNKSGLKNRVFRSKELTKDKLHIADHISQQLYALKYDVTEALPKEAKTESFFAQYKGILHTLEFANQSTEKAYGKRYSFWPTHSRLALVAQKAQKGVNAYQQLYPAADIASSSAVSPANKGQR